MPELVRLYVRCKRCGTAFDTGRVVSDRDLKKGSVKGQRYTCRHCAVPGQYTKKDYLPRALP